MRINHRRFYIFVPQQVLHGANVVTNFLCAVGVTLEAIASLTRSNNFLGRADSVEQVHNASIKYDFNNTYVPRKAKRKIYGSLLTIYL